MWNKHNLPISGTVGFSWENVSSSYQGSLEWQGRGPSRLRESVHCTVIWPAHPVPHSSPLLLLMPVRLRWNICSRYKLSVFCKLLCICKLNLQKVDSLHVWVKTVHLFHFMMKYSTGYSVTYTFLPTFCRLLREMPILLMSLLNLSSSWSSTTEVGEITSPNFLRITSSLNCSGSFAWVREEGKVVATV